MSKTAENVIAGKGADVLSKDEWPEMLELLYASFGPEAVGELFRFMESPAGLAAMANPATFVHDASRRFDLALAGRGQPTDEQFGVLVLDALRRARLVTAREVRDVQFLASPVGPDALAFLEHAQAACGAREVIACFRDTAASTLWSEGTFRGMLQLLRVALATPQGSFEERVHELVRATCGACERWYKPLLQVALRIDRLMRGDPRPLIPATIGEVMGQCRDLWSSGGPITMLDVDIRMVRNAAAHWEVDIEVAKEEVTFVNRPGRGRPPEILGPWTEGQLRAFAERFLGLCWTISIAYVRFFVEVACRVLDSNASPVAQDSR